MGVLSIGRSSARNVCLQSAVVLFFVLFTFPAQAARPLDVVINEIAWMGDTISYNNEWIELYNNTETEVNLSGWKLMGINFSGIIPPRRFYLLERTNDNTVPDVPADQVYTGALGNKGENLALFDNFGSIIDQTDCSKGWFAGDNATKQTMERKKSQLSGNDSTNWGTSQKTGGTPKKENDLTASSPLSAGVSTEEMNPPSEPITQTELAHIIYPTGIIINEILPSPEGEDSKEEWIELFNQNTSEINLSGWQLFDITGAIKTYTFPEDTVITAGGFLTFYRPTTKITLNNSDDGLKLVQPDGNIIGEVKYENAPRGQSYSLTDLGWGWNSYLTPGASNKIPEVISEKKQEIIFEDLSQEGIKLQTNYGMAAIGGQRGTKFPYNHLPVPLVALIFAMLSSLMILILKTKLQEKKNLLR